MAGRLPNKVTIVTGGNSGIGAAIASGFCEERAVTWIADVSLQANRQTAVRLGGNARAVQLNVARLEPDAIC
jgi:NAD(P)-dependent dehydrogenase (short-subunit alcohol dehydrogenase family)